MQQFTQLSDRILWFDGDSTIKSEDVTHENLTYGSVFVDTITPDIIQYNKLVTDPTEKICVKSDVKQLDLSWNLPDEYKSMSVAGYVYSKLDRIEQVGKFTDKQFQQRADRVAHELSLFKKYKLTNVLRTIIYIIDTFTVNDTVWGVGRGSSVASYVLYLIGVHDIDSVEYDLDINEFLH